LRVKHVDRRQIDEVAANRLQLGDIARLIARIAVEVFGRGELQRVDEDRDDDLVGLGFRPLHKIEMTGVKGAHGRDETNFRPICFPYVRLGAKLGDRTHAPQGRRTHSVDHAEFRFNHLF